MDNNKLMVSTQIRTFYSDEISCMTVKFYNTSLSFQIYPYSGKGPNNTSKYDIKQGQQTTVDADGAYALYKTAINIIENKISETNLAVPCNGASLVLERKMGMNGKLETLFSITKNNVTIPFKFKTIEHQVKENNQIVTKTIECGLGSFAKTIEGYLTGINAERHLNKLTDEFAKIQQSNPQNNYNKKPYNNNYNNGYKNNYKPKPNQWGGPSQPMNQYQFNQN